MYEQRHSDAQASSAVGTASDNEGHANGKAVISATGRLTSQNSFAYTATIEERDLDGNTRFTHCGRATATRFE